MTDPLPRLSSSDLDELMTRLSDPEYIAGGAAKADLDAVIAYHRNLRAEREAGKGKAVRARNAIAAGGPKLDIHELMKSIVTPADGGNIIRRRV